MLNGYPIILNISVITFSIKTLARINRSLVPLISSPILHRDVKDPFYTEHITKEPDVLFQLSHSPKRFTPKNKQKAIKKTSEKKKKNRYGKLKNMNLSLK